MNQHPAQGWLNLVLPLVVVVAVMALRMRRMGQERPLSLAALWIVPVLYLAIAATVFATTPPATLGVWAGCGLALALGCGLGWQRGRMMHIHVDPLTGQLRQKASMAALAFLIALIVLRTVAREAAQLGGIPIDLRALTDELIAFALGLLSVQRIEMYLRARRLLAAGRAG